VRPFEVLAMQADFVERFKDERFTAYVERCHEALLNDVYDLDMPRRSQTVEKDAQALTAGLHHALQRAEAFHVNTDMCALVQAASLQLDDDDVHDERLAPSLTGIVRLDVPLEVKDVHGSILKIHWIVWSGTVVEQGVGLQVSAWNDDDDPDDTAIWQYRPEDEREFVRRVVGRWNYTGSFVMLNGERIGPPTIAGTAIPEPMRRRFAERNETPNLESVNVPRYLHALFLMLNQTIVRTSTHEPNSKERRRLKRMPIPGKVTVIELRRSEYPDREPGESHVEWSHRWLVRGHWRWQRCGPGLSEKKRVWVHPYVKGPEDRPLVASQRIYDLRR